MKSIDPKDFRVVDKIKLKKIPTLLNIDAADDENNATKAWPDSRQKITAGQIVLTGTSAQLDGRCHAINFDPLVLPSGIEATADPILRARSSAYAESYRRRATEQLTGALKEPEND